MPAQAPEAPPEVKEWGQNTVMGVLFGLVLGGGRQWLQDRRYGQLPSTVGAPTKLHAARALAEHRTQAIVRQFNAAIRGGIVIGGLAGTFYGVQLLSSIARAKRDYKDTMAAGLATGMVFGIALPGGAATKTRSMVLGAGLGTLVGLPAGLLQDSLINMVPDLRGQQRALQPAATASGADAEASEPTRRFPEKEVDSTAAAIARLEASLKRRQDALQQQQQTVQAQQDPPQTERKKGWW